MTNTSPPTLQAIRRTPLAHNLSTTSHRHTFAAAFHSHAPHTASETSFAFLRNISTASPPAFQYSRSFHEASYTRRLLW